MDVPLRYPLELRFKLLAFAPQISVTDADGNLILYVHQKLFKLKEAVTVFADLQKQRPLYHLNADRILDISARYTFTDLAGNQVGALRRHGLRSLWRAHYEVLDGDDPIMTIREENPWIKVMDAVIGEIPILSFFTGLLFHPAYLVTRQSGPVVLRLEKQPAFFQRRFTISNHLDLPHAEEVAALLSLLMMVLLERQRG